jgi:hypothetical protein
LLGALTRIPVCRPPQPARVSGRMPTTKLFAARKIVDLIERCQAVEHGSPLVS